MEAWVNQTVDASVTATNEGTDNSTLRVLLTVDNSVVTSKVIDLAAGGTSEETFPFTLATFGVHHIKAALLATQLRLYLLATTHLQSAEPVKALHPCPSR